MNIDYIKKKPLGVLGSGLWPYKIGYVTIDLTLRLSIRIHDKPVSYLLRDYVSLLYVPLIPLGLCAGIIDDGWCHHGSLLVRGTRRVSLTKDDARNIAGYVSKTRFGWFARRSWLFALLIAALGAIGGWLLLSPVGLPGIAGALIGCGLLNRLLIFSLRWGGLAQDEYNEMHF